MLPSTVSKFGLGRLEPDSRAERLDQLKDLEEGIIRVMKEAPLELQFAPDHSTDIQHLMTYPDLTTTLPPSRADEFGNINIEELFGDLFQLDQATFFAPDPDLTRKNAMSECFP
jgi:hypothetical protein